MKAFQRIIAFVLTLSLMCGSLAGIAHAEGETPSADGKYVYDVFIAYGKTEKEAKDWLIAHNWEPISGNADFCAGKDSLWDSSISAVMGIQRTDDASRAITDMAVMNMKGGYSFPEYEALLTQKKADIDEYINTFMPVIQEFRDNYENKGSKLGKKRADLAYGILNRFYDGDPKDNYAVNDTGELLGKLLLKPLLQENGGKGSGDLQQILLEATDAATLALSVTLAIAADAGQDTWLERLAGLTGDELAKNLPKYVPEAAGQDLPDSVVSQYLNLYFKDTAIRLSKQWYQINETMTWYESYNEEHGLWAEDGESDENHSKRVDAYFESLKKTMEQEEIDAERNKYSSAGMLYFGLYEISYRGGWGETLGDFFNPFDGTEYGGNSDYFLPFAAALSPGQRAAADLLPLSTLLLIGMATEEGVDALFADVREMLAFDEEAISVYSGSNRGIFRGGVALTSAALMEKSRYDPYQDLWNFYGVYNIATYSAAILSVPILAAGVSLWIKGTPSAEWVSAYDQTIFAVNTYKNSVKHIIDTQKQIAAAVEKHNNGVPLKDLTWREQDFIEMSKKPKFMNEELGDTLAKDMEKLEENKERLQEFEEEAASYKRMSTTGKVVTAIGAAILLTAAFAKGYQVYRYYQKTFTPIPRLIVDEADIVTYSKDSEGNTVKNIEFDQFVYYQAVECNRQDVGEISDWQDGVSDYASWGCGDLADLNGDFGQEWLALYVVKSPKKGNPILADSLTLQYGSEEQPKGTSKKLHLFAYTNAVDIGDMAWSYNNDKDGVYFFWEEDGKAYDATGTASAFTRGQMAMTGAAGLLIGILGTTLVLLPRKKKRRQDDSAA